MENELKELWNKKEVKDLKTKELINALKAQERKLRNERMVALILLPLTLVALIGIISLMTQSFYYLLGLGCMFLAFAMILLPLYRSKIEIKDSTAYSNQTYIKTLLHNLELRLQITNKLMWRYAGLLILGINFSISLFAVSLPTGTATLIAMQRSPAEPKPAPIKASAA